MQLCNAKGVLVVPEWKSAPFWPIICPYPSRFATFVKEVFCFSPCSDIFLPGPGTLATYRDKQSVFQGCPNFNVLAIRISF